MLKRSGIVSYSDKQLEAMQRRGLSRTDWKRVDAMSEAELQASIAADSDDVHEEMDWTKAVIGLPPRKQDIHIRIDSDILQWFRKSGPGYQTRMNNVLRAFVNTREALRSGRTSIKKARRIESRRTAR